MQELILQSAGQLQVDHFAQLSGRLERIWRGNYSAEVPKNLDRSHDQPPRKSPPAECSGPKQAANLTLDPAATAADFGRASPPGHHERRRRAVRRMHVNWPFAATGWALPLMDLNKLLLRDLRWDLINQRHQDSFGLALLVAEDEVTASCSAPEDCRSTVVAGCHESPLALGFPGERSFGIKSAR